MRESKTFSVNMSTMREAGDFPTVLRPDVEAWVEEIKLSGKVINPDRSITLELSQDLNPSDETIDVIVTIDLLDEEEKS